MVGREDVKEDGLLNHGKEEGNQTRKWLQSDKQYWGRSKQTHLSLLCLTTAAAYMVSVRQTCLQTGFLPSIPFFKTFFLSYVQQD